MWERLLRHYDYKRIFIHTLVFSEQSGNQKKSEIVLHEVEVTSSCRACQQQLLMNWILVLSPSPGRIGGLLITNVLRGVTWSSSTS